MKILVFTGSRSDFGILKPLIHLLDRSPLFELRLIVSGSHLSPEYGETISEIEAEGLFITERTEILLSSNTAAGVVKSMGVGLISFSDAIQRAEPDLFVVLGDRYEAHAATTAAMILGVPIAHIHGGEVTMGAYDDMLRHSITKMSNLHFVANESYARRVIQLGEHPSTVFNVGAMGLDGLTDFDPMSKIMLSRILNFNLSKSYFVVTYHPTTIGNESPTEVIKNILFCLERFPEYQIVVTLPNADNGSRQIASYIDEYAALNSERVISAASLGHNVFMSILSHASAFVGNSSSGIIEAPSLRIPTVNVGARQSGRVVADSVLSCGVKAEEIYSAIQVALSPTFGDVCASCVNPYGSGGVAEKILKILASTKLSVPKKFYDLHAI
jgi:UDP-hydrolysing UDP-N-acetyl-D-glucosamine 2-epimerase